MNELIDTNVLIYAFDSSDDLRAHTARTLIEKFISNKKGSVTLQILGECYAVLRKKGLPANGCRTIFHVLRKKFACYDATESSYEYAIELAELYGIHFWDALIAAVMLENASQSKTDHHW